MKCIKKHKILSHSDRTTNNIGSSFESNMGSADVSGRLLTQLVDQQAKDQPDRLYCLHPSSQDADCEWRCITFHQVSAAVNRVAWWIDSRLLGRKQQILAYIGTNDLRYLVFELACMKTGHAV